MRGTLVAVAALMGCLQVACSDDEPAGTAGPGGGGAGAQGGGGAQQGGGGSDGGSGGDGGSAGAGGGASFARQFLYVANQGDDTVLAYSITEDGTLAPLGTTPVAGGPGPLAVSLDKSRLYVASVGSQAVTAFDLDTTTGALTLIDETSVGISPVHILVDATGGYLLLASYNANAARSYAILPDGSVDGNAISSLNPGTNSHSIWLDASNGFAFVPNTNADTISQLVFDDATGTLAPNPAGAEIDVDEAQPIGPRHMAFHPTLPVVYAVNEHDDSVTAFDLAPATGILTEGATVSTLAAGPDPGNTCADIHITPNGAFVYASNRGDDSIAMFTVDPSDGSLTANGRAPTEPTPREFEVTPDGRFLYAAGQASDMLASYRIEDDGTLTPLTVYDVGDTPMWVLAVGISR
jgi:6-phosphogluconolactonase